MHSRHMITIVQVIEMRDARTLYPHVRSVLTIESAIIQSSTADDISSLAALPSSRESKDRSFNPSASARYWGVGQRTSCATRRGPQRKCSLHSFRKLCGSFAIFECRPGAKIALGASWAGKKLRKLPKTYWHEELATTRLWNAVFSSAIARTPGRVFQRLRRSASKRVGVKDEVLNVTLRSRIGKYEEAKTLLDLVI